MHIINQQSKSSKILNKLVCIGGSARSGTTIMGKLMHSLKNVEYFYEPPMLENILLKNDELTKESLRELIEFYFYENFLLDCIAGRNINLNLHDDSCILHVKSKEEIDNRTKKSLTRVEFDEAIDNVEFTFKLPEIVFFLNIINDFFPENRTILMHRNPNDVINSIVKKRWFCEEYMNENHASQLFTKKIYKGKKVPYWILEEDEEFWVTTSEYNRCAYYYKRISESILEYSDTSIVVDYDSFIKKPHDTLSLICEKFKLKQTKETENILKTVKFQEKKREPFLEELDKKLSNKIIELDNILKEKSIFNV